MAPCSPGRVGRLVVLVLLTLAGVAGPVAAQQTLVDDTQAPLVRIDAGTADVQIHGWNRTAVQVDADPSVEVNRTRGFSVPVTTVPILAGSVDSLRGTVRLPEESFAVTTLGPEPRDVVTVTAHDTDRIDVEIPNATALLVVQTNRGVIAIHTYTGGTFVARIQQGRVRLDRDGGAGFVQIMRGPIVVNDSVFERIRTRTALGPTYFEDCRVQQIQATSVDGAIVYDGGTFDQGLARFQSQNGPVAIGVVGAAEIGGRGSHVYTDFTQHVDLPQRSDDAATAVVGGGGPWITAASHTNDVFLYDGSLRTRSFGAGWTKITRLSQRFPERVFAPVAPAVPVMRAPPPAPEIRPARRLRR